MKTTKTKAIPFILVILSFCFFLPPFHSFSQVSVIPQGFNYQAIARDTLGSPKANQNVTIRFTITNQTETNTPYIETHVKTTDEFGLFTAVIGQGTQSGGTGTFSQVDWKTYSYYVKIEIQESSNWHLIGKEPLLSVPYAMVAKEAVYTSPPGSIIAFGGTTPPSGWLICDGTNYTVTQYPELFAAIGTNFGGISGANFNVPDFRGKFLRGVDGLAGNDPDAGIRTASNLGGNIGNNVGSIQSDAFQGHWHAYNSSNGTIDNARPLAGALGSSADPGTWSSIVGPISDGTNGTPRNTSETRPKNVYVNYIIKY